MSKSYILKTTKTLLREIKEDLNRKIYSTHGLEDWIRCQSPTNW